VESLPAAPYDERVCHDLYGAGHFIEAAVAHHKTTGNRDLLNAAVKLADSYLTAMKNGHPYFRIVGRRVSAARLPRPLPSTSLPPRSLPATSAKSRSFPFFF
jgi:hypothetical protein